MELWQIFIRWLGQRASFLSTFLILSGECQPLPRVPRPRRREHGCPSSVCTPPLRSPPSPAAHALGSLSEESRVLHIHSAQQSSTILLLFCMSFMTIRKTCSPHHGAPLHGPFSCSIGVELCQTQMLPPAPCGIVVNIHFPFC